MEIKSGKEVGYVVDEDGRFAELMGLPFEAFNSDDATA
jgi:hypothetical protein